MSEGLHRPSPSSSARCPHGKIRMLRQCLQRFNELFWCGRHFYIVTYQCNGFQIIPFFVAPSSRSYTLAAVGCGSAAPYAAREIDRAPRSFLFQKRARLVAPTTIVPRDALQLVPRAAPRPILCLAAAPYGRRRCQLACALITYSLVHDCRWTTTIFAVLGHLPHCVLAAPSTVAFEIAAQAQGSRRYDVREMVRELSDAAPQTDRRRLKLEGQKQRARVSFTESSAR